MHARTFPAFAVATVVAALLVAVTWTPQPAGATTPTPVLERRVLGYSVQHRPIMAYHLGSPAYTRVAVIIGEMHGDERAGVAVARALVNGTSSIVGLSLWVIPELNPDGYAANRRQNAHGVDLNRNWPYNWAHLTGQYYSGPYALSEPETAAVHAFLLAVRPRYIVSMHQPLYGVDTSDGGALDPAFASRLATNLGLPRKAFRCWSVCHGSMTGWYAAHRYGAGITVEFGSNPSATYLAGTARRGIIAAMGGGFGDLSARNPRSALTVDPRPGGAYVHGWAFDYDNRAAHVPVALYRDGRLTNRGYAAAASPTISALFHLPGSHGYHWTLIAGAGRHTYCVTFTNVGSGTADPQRCVTVTVPPKG